MKTEFAYTVYHVNHIRLLALERTGGDTDDEKMAAKDYQSMMSNLPRHDPSIRNTFGSETRTLAESIEDKNRNLKQMNDRKLQRKLGCAERLFKLGYYIEVASVDLPTGQEAVTATTSVNERWWLIDSKVVRPQNEPWRSTDSYDIVKRFHEYFFKLPLGFVDLKEKAYAESLV